MIANADYSKLIERLMNNDHNAEYDLLLEDSDDDLEVAVDKLIEILRRITDEILEAESGIETDEWWWYNERLTDAKSIKNSL